MSSNRCCFVIYLLCQLSSIAFAEQSSGITIALPTATDPGQLTCSAPPQQSGPTMWEGEQPPLHESIIAATIARCKDSENQDPATEFESYQVSVGNGEFVTVIVNRICGKCKMTSYIHKKIRPSCTSFPEGQEEFIYLRHEVNNWVEMKSASLPLPSPASGDKPGGSQSSYQNLKSYCWPMLDSREVSGVTEWQLKCGQQCGEGCSEQLFVSESSEVTDYSKCFASGTGHGQTEPTINGGEGYNPPDNKYVTQSYYKNEILEAANEVCVPNPPKTKDLGKFVYHNICDVIRGDSTPDHDTFNDRITVVNLFETPPFDPFYVVTPVLMATYPPGTYPPGYWDGEGTGAGSHTTQGNSGSTPSS